MDESALVAGVQRMRSGPLLGLVVEPFHVGLQLTFVDPPLTAAADLYGGELTGSDEGVSLGDAHVEVDRDVLEFQEPRLDSRGRLPRRGSSRAAHEAILASDRPEYVD
jgi:hypothetical protein